LAIFFLIKDKSTEFSALLFINSLIINSQASMDKNYAQYLLNQTRENYNSISQEFSNTRSFVWKELKPLVEYITKGDKLLDLGCGNGRILQVFKNAEYYGIDNSENLIRIAKEKYPEASFREGDVLNIPFKENSFDKIYSIAVLHHIPSKELRIKFFKEAKWVLKPNGIFILTVWNIPFKLVFKYALLKIFKKTKLDFKDVFIPWGNIYQRYVHCFTIKELKNIAKEAGFNVKEKGFLGKNIYLVLDKKEKMKYK